MRTHAPRTRSVSKAVLTTAVGSALILGALAEPSWSAPAVAAKYPGQGKCPPGDYQLCINGGPGGFTIKGRTFSGHDNAILLRNVSNVTITGNTFKNLSGANGYAGVHVKNSSGIVIKKNTFSNLRNKGHMHGVYLVKTTGSTITGNKFSSITGDPVRLRDGSRNNTVSGNTSTKSGTYAIVSEWRDPKKGETCGGGNVVKNNKYGPGYYGKSLPLILWGGKGSGKSGPNKLTWKNCKKATVVNKGGNKRF
ncbi:right-handed parallel beta-helix repeat-containing protein [Streptomyces ipomoeae]|uniref:Right-handed parallel beta-helix repeat-containing protein n=1 Tax=Streptomyces ipomoeae TaxID=103232 RepID=A0AAE8VVH2_9ACTN|nr:right-handed parallel beta-helix repeat-containing protein [Streptomyces ipomoeae]TQE21945.1 right-handed parallel beta-helix repeat-containing protein [Streptomyces ipomoeae]TQE34920.1 right-handed parallel beta-helix repeat-containing protein [Streptomyces ipomoeae]